MPKATIKWTEPRAECVTIDLENGTMLRVTDLTAEAANRLADIVNTHDALLELVKDFPVRDVRTYENRDPVTLSVWFNDVRAWMASRTRILEPTRK